METPDIHAAADKLADMMLEYNERRAKGQDTDELSEHIEWFIDFLKTLGVSVSGQARHRDDGQVPIVIEYKGLDVGGFLYNFEQIGHKQKLLDMFLPIIRSLDKYAAGYSRFEYDFESDMVRIRYHDNYVNQVSAGNNDGDMLNRVLCLVQQNKERDYENFHKGQD